MTAPILVTGGTGTLGGAVVARLGESGSDVRVLSRRARSPDDPAYAQWATGDLATGEGLAAAVSGAGTIVHCATDRRLGRGDVDGARRLLAAAGAAGVSHVVYVSIVGVDRVPFSYYHRKLEVERLVEDSGLGWTILRATQFHDLVLLVAGSLARSPVVPVPAGTSFQPVDAREVAERLAVLATSAPSGRQPDLGGPRVQTARDLMRTYLDAAGTRRLVLPVRLPGAVFRGYRQGGHLAPGHAVGRLDFAGFLRQRLPRRGAG